MKTGLNFAGKIFVAIVVAFVIASFSTGCVIRTYKEGNTEYRSISILAGGSVAPFSLEAGKKDDPSYRKLDSKGVTNDSTAVVEAAVSAAIRAAKP